MARKQGRHTGDVRKRQRELGSHLEGLKESGDIEIDLPITGNVLFRETSTEEKGVGGQEMVIDKKKKKGREKTVSLAGVLVEGSYMGT